MEQSPKQGQLWPCAAVRAFQCKLQLELIIVFIKCHNECKCYWVTVPHRRFKASSTVRPALQASILANAAMLGSFSHASGAYE